MKVKVINLLERRAKTLGLTVAQMRANTAYVHWLNDYYPRLLQIAEKRKVEEDKTTKV